MGVATALRRGRESSSGPSHFNKGHDKAPEASQRRCVFLNQFVLSWLLRVVQAIVPAI